MSPSVQPWTASAAAVAVLALLALLLDGHPEVQQRGWQGWLRLQPQHSPHVFAPVLVVPQQHLLQQLQLSTRKAALWMPPCLTLPMPLKLQWEFEPMVLLWTWVWTVVLSS